MNCNHSKIICLDHPDQIFPTIAHAAAWAETHRNTMSYAVNDDRCIKVRGRKLRFARTQSLAYRQWRGRRGGLVTSERKSCVRRLSTQAALIAA